jgi:hypothetical protein
VTLKPFRTSTPKKNISLDIKKTKEGNAIALSREIKEII